MDSTTELSDDIQSLSVKLSQTLDEVGLNEKIVTMRRRKGMLKESLETIVLRLLDKNAFLYTFGSQIEGTTTYGLQSDTDCVLCDYRAIAIPCLDEFKPGVKNYLIIQDENVPPGYCLLKHITENQRYLHRENDDLSNVNGEALLRNSDFFNKKERYVRNGPAETEQGRTGFQDADRVYSLPCKSWPLQACNWFCKETICGWPTNEMKHTCKSAECFVVPVGNKESDSHQLEWRFSTSVAERVLMFNINITQLRCYTLMKMIVKKFISKKYPDTISSFMCKTVLFHCIANSPMQMWRENYLLNCLNYCLSMLYLFALDGNCPHFMIPKNNLFKGHLTVAKKHFLLKTLKTILLSKGKSLFDIECDSIGPLLSLKFHGIIDRGPNVSARIAGQLMSNSGLEIDWVKYLLLSEINKLDLQSALQKLSQFMLKLINVHSSSKGPCKLACCFTAQIIGRALGSVEACSQIKHNKTLTLQALTWFSSGLQYDLSSSKLKVASFLYCSENTNSLETALKGIEECYDLNVVEPLCRCYHFPRRGTKSDFDELCLETHNEYALLKRITAACVIFLPCEIDCCPCELQYEMFRSVIEMTACRGEEDRWMDWAVVDSLSYLYFLQYKTYDRLQKTEEKEKALTKLEKVIHNEPNLGHKETALNLLGQCLEQEGYIACALKCFMSSLQTRGSNNAAKIHLCRVINAIVNQTQMK